MLLGTTTDSDTVSDMRPLSPASIEQADIDARLRAELDATSAAAATTVDNAGHGGRQAWPPAPAAEWWGGAAWPPGPSAVPTAGTRDPAASWAGYPPGPAAVAPGPAPAPVTTTWRPGPVGESVDRPPGLVAGAPGTAQRQPGTTEWQPAPTTAGPHVQPQARGIYETYPVTPGGAVPARRHRQQQREPDCDRVSRKRRKSSDQGRRHRRRRRHYDTSSSSSSSSEGEEEETVCRRRMLKEAPVRVKSAAPPTSLRLPAIAAGDARALRDRRRFVPVGQTAPGGGALATTGSLIAAIAALLAHTVFYFPDMGLQAMVYMAWLADRGTGRDVREVRGMDSRARQAMSLRPWEFMTQSDLDQFLPTPAPVTGRDQSSTRRGPGGPGVTTEHCFKFQRGSCSRICPYGRIHIPCGTCGSALHGTAFHNGRTGGTGPQVPPSSWARGRQHPGRQ